MSRFRNWLYRFMSGRYGADELSRFLFVAYLVVFVLSLVFGWFEDTQSVAFLLRLSLWGILLWSLFRMLSRNANKRRNENQKYLTLHTRVREWAKFTKARLRDIRTKRYRHCPHCRAVVRFPIKRGVHLVSCPRCRKQFQLKIRF